MENNQDNEYLLRYISGHPLGNFCNLVDSSNISMPIEMANNLLGSKEQIYNTLNKMGYFLPDFNCEGVTVDYLFKVVRAEVYFVYENQIKKHPKERKKYSKIDLMSYLESKIFQGKSGFKFPYLPNKSWLLSILFLHYPNHEVFSGLEIGNVMVTVPLR